jgi:hypothetical protein
MKRSLIALTFACAACGTTAKGTSVTKDPAPVVASQKKVDPPPPPPADPTIKTLKAEPFVPGGAKPTEVYAIEGALVVVEGPRVGRVVGDGVEWIGKIPKTTPHVGENSIVSVSGRFPDAVGALFMTSQGRAPMPTYELLTGKAASHTEAPGGGWGMLYPARIGESIIVAVASTVDGHRLLTVRGPKLARSFTPATDVCKPGEENPAAMPSQVQPALAPAAFESTTAGTLLSLGTLCMKRGPAAEIWDKTTGKPRIVTLDTWWKKASYGAQLFKSSGDELFAYENEFQPMLRYADGAFTPLPVLASPPSNVFVSPAGQLYALAANRTIYKLADAKWTAVARAPDDYRSMAIDADGAFWAGGADKVVYRLRDAGTERFDDACPSWFVYLYEASSQNAGTWTYPTTRKVLSTFPDASSLGLVEFGGYPKHVGVTVTSKSQGEALITHVRSTMKDEDPRLFCFSPKKNVRRITAD